MNFYECLLYNAAERNMESYMHTTHIWCVKHIYTYIITQLPLNFKPKNVWA